MAIRSSCWISCSKVKRKNARSGSGMNSAMPLTISTLVLTMMNRKYDIAHLTTLTSASTGTWTSAHRSTRYRPGLSTKQGSFALPHSGKSRRMEVLNRLLKVICTQHRFYRRDWASRFSLWSRLVFCEQTVLSEYMRRYLLLFNDMEN